MWSRGSRVRTPSSTPNNLIMDDLSEQAIRENCPHCSISSQAFNYMLEETDNFYIVCDAHPLTEGHILIIPKKHVTCIGEYPEDIFKEFLKLNEKVSQFLISEYKSVSSFEHGVFGQTVFHSHIHYLPFMGRPTDIVPEGEDKLSEVSELTELKSLFDKNGGYLFFSIGQSKWSVDVSIATPRFFRDRYAIALKRPERGNWKKMTSDKRLMEQGREDNTQTQEKWKNYFS